MKFFYFFIFLIAVSCNTGKKTYVCGDHTCVDREEFNEYFDNLSERVLQLQMRPLFNWFTSPCFC